MNGHEQTKLGPKWRHLCLKAVDLFLEFPQSYVSLTIELSRPLMFQGTDPSDAKVMIQDKFQGAYVCAPEVLVQPVLGTLQFIGNGWVYRPSQLPLIGMDSFVYSLRANGLESNTATVYITGV